ncbi:DUF6924 domain-containing protein [Amycolatopsis minnesotensis]|uniref:Bulb-type lectin domain-containing protein n=1 Tax=Amycolatopsis minnesotensis TaxID=337894 RepID=A0ABN2SGL0_9PSEU
MQPVSDQESVFAFRIWLRTRDSAEWEPGHDLLVQVDDGGIVVLEQLSWDTVDGALTTIGFAPDMASCRGHGRTGNGDVVQVRGELRGRTKAGGVRHYEFDAEPDDGPAGRLRVLIDDGAGAPLRSVTWRDRTGGSCSVALRSASPSGNADVSDLVSFVWVSAEHPAADEVAANLVDGTSSKWFAPHDRAVLEFEFPQPIAVDRYALTSANDADDRDPARWTLRGSADGLRWRTLDTRADQSFADRHQSRTYRIAEPGAYAHYRLDIDDTNGSPDVQLEAVRFLAESSGFTGYRQRAGQAPVAYRGVRVARESPSTPAEPLPDGSPGRRMRLLPEYDSLPAGTELVSPSGRYALRYDSGGVPVVADRTTHQIVWRAGDDEQHPAAGELRLSGSVQVELRNGEVWHSAVADVRAKSLVVTDEGELELLDDIGVGVYNSRHGFVGSQPVFRDSAPVADITLKRFLYGVNTKGAVARTVRREPDGSLWGSELTMSYSVASPPLARWLEQEGTVLTWRQVPTTQGTDLEPCLLDAAGNLLWRRGSARSSTTPPPAEPHDHGGPAMGPGSRLRRQSLTSPSGSHTLQHHDNGNLALYCNAVHSPVWTTGTDWAGDGWADLDRNGDLVLRTSCGAPVWRSGTADLGAVRLAVRDDGTVALLDAEGTAVWEAGEHGPCAATGHTPPRGAVLRRGQTLRTRSLTSDDGGTVLCHQPEQGVRLYGVDGIQLWYAEGADLALDPHGYLQVRGDGGSVLDQLAGPGDHLRVMSGGEIRLCAEDGTVVWREGRHVIDGTVTTASSHTVPPAALQALLNSSTTPIVRTDFSDHDAWETAWRDITALREYWDDEVVLDATLIAEPGFDGCTGENLAELLLPYADECDLVFVVDATTLASPEHPVLVLEIDPEHEPPRSFRATPNALLDVEIQLSLANMDWEDFSESADPDGILRESSAD